jgi:hypothetical protein
LALFLEFEVTHTFSLREEEILCTTVSHVLAKISPTVAKLTMIGTQVAFNTAKMIYVFQPILRIAGGVIYTMIKLQIQLAAVDMELPFCLALSGRISEGYTYRAKRIQNQYSCLQTSLRVGCTLRLRDLPRRWLGNRW